MAALKALIRASDCVVEFQTYFEERAEKEFSTHALNILKVEILRRWAAFQSCYDNVLEKFDDLHGDIEMEALRGILKYYLK